MRARCVQGLQEYHPPLAVATGLRLDFNENTAGCSPRVLQRLTKITAEDFARYPERRAGGSVAAAISVLRPTRCCLQMA